MGRCIAESHPIARQSFLASFHVVVQPARLTGQTMNLQCTHQRGGHAQGQRRLQAVEAVNQFQKQRPHALISAHFGGGVGGLAGRRFAVWGLAFKPNTDDMREAPSRELLHALWRDGATVAAYDPKATDEARRLYPAELADGRLVLCETKEAAADGADALVLCTEWKRFMAPNFEQLATSLRQKLIFDGRNLYDPCSACSRCRCCANPKSAAPPIGF
ncbi:UDP-glucose/GDP-mannose dehydrogenase family protein [bacterium]|nr:UDP-glucose/GDP-mannose dehydrogenase family protein [bacterium]